MMEKLKFTKKLQCDHFRCQPFQSQFSNCESCYNVEEWVGMMSFKIFRKNHFYFDNFLNIFYNSTNFFRQGTARRNEIDRHANYFNFKRTYIGNDNFLQVN